MNCVILQPSYIPWRGYFHQIQKADLFVFYDDVPYDARGWRNRNRVKAPQGTRWLTIPVHHKGCREDRTPIDAVRIDWDRDWSRKHLATLEHLYREAPHFRTYRPLLAEFYRRRDDMLAEFTIDLSKALAGALGLEGKEFLRSSSLKVSGRKTERLLAILKAVGATHYITGPSAKDYLEEEKLAEAGLTLEYMAYGYPEYEQLHPPYDPQVTVLDLLFMKGPRAGEYIW